MTSHLPAQPFGERNPLSVRLAVAIGAQSVHPSTVCGLFFPLCFGVARPAIGAHSESRLPLRPELAGKESWKRSARLGCDCHPGAGALESEKERERKS